MSSLRKKKEMKETERTSRKEAARSDTFFPLLALRDLVVFPGVVVPLFVKRDESIAALEMALTHNKELCLVSQRDPEAEVIDKESLYETGTLSTVLQHMRLADGTVKILVEGFSRVRIDSVVDAIDHLSVVIDWLDDIEILDDAREYLMVRTLTDQFANYARETDKVRDETVKTICDMTHPGQLADIIAAHLPIALPKKQAILDELDIDARIEQVLLLLESEMDIVKLERKVKERIKKRLEDSHRMVYLDEKLKALEEERSGLGSVSSSRNEVDQLIDKIKKSSMSKEAKEKALEEANKLKQMPMMSAESTVIRTYIEWLLKLPWKRQSKTSKDLKASEDILDADHYGLEKVKERIMEYLAVCDRVKNMNGPILCLVGPPGVGKTSIGRSIAHATGRKFVRLSLGGVRDEAEIRGHRRTYVGAMPGKIVEKLAKVKAKNPVFMLDEIDKMVKDPYRGDPGSALLEVLDPEQNGQFNDHYIELDFDLSKVLFVATANSMDIPSPLLDRMEVIRIPGYTEQEKMRIAMEHLLPKQMANHKLSQDDIQLTELAVREILRYYTREAGVRELERHIASICRKVVKKLQVLTKAKRNNEEIIHTLPFIIDENAIPSYLGVKRYQYGLAEKHSRIGQVYGLAWTSVGGELLTIEATVVPGKGKSVYTGQLGDVMQESIQAAITVIRSRTEMLGLLKDFYSKCDIHVHFPEGATPKDGPSAGIGICLSTISALTSIPVRSDIAMTGEITLRGEILPIGGLKEKLLAALQAGIKMVLIPEGNRKDLEEVPKEVLEGLTIKPVKWIDDVLSLALVKQPPFLKKSPYAFDGESQGSDRLPLSKEREEREGGGLPAESTS